MANRAVKTSGIFGPLLWLLTFSAFAETNTWHCGTDTEVWCFDGKCTARAEEDGDDVFVFALFDTNGLIQVCAYTGCYEGKGRVLSSSPFLVIEARQVPWSDPNNPDPEDVLIALDTEDSVAMVKAGSLSLPLICKKSEIVLD